MDKGWNAGSLRLALAVTLLIPAAALAQSAGERFTANLVDPQGRVTVAPVVITINRYTPDAEVPRLAGILSQKGPNALRDALWELDEAGYLRVGGSLGYPIAVARSANTESGRVVRLMMDRPIAFWESWNNSRSLDYPFSYIELRLDSNGKGEGQMIPAARVSLSGGTLDVEGLGFQPVKLLNVQKR